MSKLGIFTMALCTTFFLLLSCNSKTISEDEKTKTQNYIDTPEEVEEITPYFNSKKDAIHKLPKTQYKDSLTSFACEVLEQMNLDLYMQDKETIVDGFSGKDSVQYWVLIELFTPVSYLFIGNNKRTYSKKEVEELKKMMEEKCGNTFAKYKEMEKKHLAVLKEIGLKLWN